MEYEQDGSELPLKRQNNTLPIYGNKETMNLNSMLLTNIRASPYFKTDLFELKTFHEVVDEIYYKVRSLTHLVHIGECFFFELTFLMRRWSTWNHGRRTAENSLDKSECVQG